MKLHRSLGWLFCVLLVACGDPAGTAPDTGHAAPDAAGTDAAVTDGGGDAGSTDGGSSDGGIDAPPGDAGVPADAGSDAGDGDGDGFDATTETACGTDPADGASHPDPAVLRGAGTSTDPYRICFGEHLALFALLPGVATAHARVGRDLDLTGIEVAPIGMGAAPYVARFDGAGHRIAHFAPTAATPTLGLFGLVGTTGEVVDFALTEASSTTASLVASQNAGLLSGLRVEGTITDAGGHGGMLVGESSGTIRDCHTSGTLVSLSNHVGGLVGANAGTILRCSSTVSVSANNRVGGLVGSLMTGSIAESWASGTVVGTGLNHGGLVGTAFAGTISDSFALGDVTGAQGVGGLIGQSEAAVVVTRVYARGHVSGTMSAAVVGISNATTPAAACYFDASTATSDVSCTGLTPAQLTMPASFVSFDFATPVWVIDSTIRPSPSLHWE